MTTAPRLTVAAVEEALGPIEGCAHNCHRAALALVRWAWCLTFPKWRWARS